jgi:hypothetical protein
MISLKEGNQKESKLYGCPGYCLEAVLRHSPGKRKPTRSGQPECIEFGREIVCFH